MLPEFAAARAHKVLLEGVGLLIFERFVSEELLGLSNPSIKQGMCSLWMSGASKCIAGTLTPFCPSPRQPRDPHYCHVSFSFFSGQMSFLECIPLVTRNQMTSRCLESNRNGHSKCDNFTGV